MDKDIVISIKTVVLTIFLFLSVYVLYKLGPILVSLVVATLLVISLEPAVKFFMNKTFMNKPVPRGLAVSITFALFILAVIFVLTVGLPPVLTQAQKLLKNLSELLQKIPGQKLPPVGDLTSIFPQISSISGNILTITFSVFSNVFSVLSVLFISLYMSLDWINIKKRFLSLFSGKLEDEVKASVEEVETSIGHWVKGQLFLMLIVGSASFLGLMLLGVDFPLALGIISGFFEIVPVLGPILSAALAATVGFADSPVKGIAVLGLYVVIQQSENNFLVPKVMQKVSGFSPLVIILALLVGSEFFGILGAILAVPITMILVIIFKRFLRYQR